MKNKINIKGFLFDLDGTLIQSMYEHFIAWKKTFIKYGVEIHENDFYPLEGSKLSEIVKIISKKNRIKKPNIKEIIKTKERYYNSSSNIIFARVDSGPGAWGPPVNYVKCVKKTM